MMSREILFFCFIVIIPYSLYSQSVNDTVKIKEVDIQSKKTFNRNVISPLKLITAPDVGELLSKQTHLFVKSYGIGSMASVSMRGTGSAHTNLYWNNLNLNSSTNGITDVALYPSFFLDRLQVNKGLESNELGSGGLGGAVHFESSGGELIPNVSIAHKVGSFGLHTTEFLARFKRKKLLSTTKLLISSADNDFEYRDLTLQGFPKRKVSNAEYQQRGLLQSFRYGLKKGHITARFWAFTSDRNLPPFITIRENLENQKDDYVIGQLVYEKPIQNGSLSIQSSVKHTKLEYKNLQASIHSTSSGLDVNNLLILTKNIKSRLQWRSRLGYDLNTVKDESFTTSINRNRIGFYNALKFYGNDENSKPWKHWTALISLRQEYLVNEDFFIVPTAEIEFQPNLEHDFFLFTKFGRNIKYPTLNDLYRQPFANANLKTEKSNSAELGINYRQNNLNDYVSFSQLSFYYNDIEDYILWRPTIYGYWQPFNLSAVETGGIELVQGFETDHHNDKFLKEFKVLYAYTESINREKLSEFDESEGKQLIYIPRHKASVNFIVAFKAYEMSVTNQYISERFTSTDNFEQVDAFQLTDITIGRAIKFKKHILNLHASVLNVFDEDYQAIQWRPMPGRNYQLKLKYTFTK